MSTELLTLMQEAVTSVVHTLDVEYCDVSELLHDGQTLLLRGGAGWREGRRARHHGRGYGITCGLYVVA